MHGPAWPEWGRREGAGVGWAPGPRQGRGSTGPAGQAFLERLARKGMARGGDMSRPQHFLNHGRPRASTRAHVIQEAVNSQKLSDVQSALQWSQVYLVLSVTLTRLENPSYAAAPAPASGLPKMPPHPHPQSLPPQRLLLEMPPSPRTLVTLQ